MARWEASAARNRLVKIIRMVPHTRYNPLRLTVLKTRRKPFGRWINGIQLGTHDKLDRAGVMKEPDNGRLIGAARGVGTANSSKVVPVLEPGVSLKKLSTTQEHTLILLAGDEMKRTTSTKASTSSSVA